MGSYLKIPTLAPLPSVRHLIKLFFTDPINLYTNNIWTRKDDFSFMCSKSSWSFRFLVDCKIEIKKINLLFTFQIIFVTHH